MNRLNLDDSEEESSILCDELMSAIERGYFSEDQERACTTSGNTMKEIETPDKSMICTNYFDLLAEPLLFKTFHSRGAYILYTEFLLIKAKCCMPFEFLIDMRKDCENTDRIENCISLLENNEDLCQRFYDESFHRVTEGYRAKLALDLQIAEGIDQETESISEQVTCIPHVIAVTSTLTEWMLGKLIREPIKKIIFDENNSINNDMVYKQIVSKMHHRTFNHAIECSDCFPSMHFAYLNHEEYTPHQIFCQTSNPALRESSRNLSKAIYKEAFSRYKKDGLDN